MTRRAIIENGIVTNIIEADPDFELPGKTLVEAGDAGIGWTWDGSSFTPSRTTTRACPRKRHQATSPEMELAVKYGSTGGKEKT